MANLATQLFEHGKIETTQTRAKRVQPLVEHLITKAKRGDLAARRIVAKTITSKPVLVQLVNEIAPAVADREGGYTRVTRTSQRKGDGAQLAIIEIVTEPVVAKPKKVKADAPKANAKEAEAPTAPVEAEEVVTDSADELEAIETIEEAIAEATGEVAEATPEAEAAE
jgi:large subunit ribosomal protein L17